MTTTVFLYTDGFLILLNIHTIYMSIYSLFEIEVVVEASIFRGNLFM